MRLTACLIVLCLIAGFGRSGEHHRVEIDDAAVSSARIPSFALLDSREVVGAARMPSGRLAFARRTTAPIAQLDIDCVVPTLHHAHAPERRVSIVATGCSSRDRPAPDLVAPNARGPPASIA